MSARLQHLAAGVGFIDDNGGGPGVRLRTNPQKKATKMVGRATHQSESNGLSLARTSSSTVAEALQMKRDPRCSHEALRN